MPYKISARQSEEGSYSGGAPKKQPGETASKDRLPKEVRYREMAELMRSWMECDDPEQEDFWEILQEELKKDPISFRE